MSNLEMHKYKYSGTHRLNLRSTLAMSTTTTTTSTAQAREDARTQVASALPNDEAKTKAGDDLIAKLSTEGVKKQAYESVKTLAHTIRDIRKGFLSVADALIIFDAKNFEDKDDNVLSLGKEWSPLIEVCKLCLFDVALLMRRHSVSQEFDTTLQFSLEQATAAVVMMKSMSLHSCSVHVAYGLTLTAITAVLGSVAENDGKDLAIELNNFMETLRTKEAGALEMKKRFQKLADDVGLFTAKIDVALQKAEEEIKTDLAHARARLADLNNELEAYVFAVFCMPH
jgi:hypothetical protein